MSDERPPAVELNGIWKRFPGVIANRDVDLTVRAGSIHSIVGENGAGKSTLMKILYGMQQPDEGTIAIDGSSSTFKNPTDAIAAGIGMVHQHFMLADNFTVVENVILGAEPSRRGIIDFADAEERLERICADHGITLDLTATTGDLGVGERQRVEILKVLYRGARILILDEPTAVLVPQEVDDLFVNFHELTDEGVTIIFISHKLDEVLSISDDITVMRDGTTVATVTPDETDRHGLGVLMVGDELPVADTTDVTMRDEVIVSVTDLAAEADEGRPAIKDLSFDVRSGEIVGIAGVSGNGQFELAEVLLGLRPPSHGSMTFRGEDLSALDVAERREAGIAYIPFDRHREALMLGEPLWENMILGRDRSDRFGHGPMMSAGMARAEVSRAIERFDVAAPSPDVPAYALSGGNQQKFVVGREMMAAPTFLIAAHPTRGVDIGAQAAIWEELRAARAAGLAVLLISADLEELIGLSDSLLVMFRGEITAHLDPATATPAQLGVHMAGQHQEAS